MERMEGVYLRVPAGRLRDALAAAVGFVEAHPGRMDYAPVRMGDFQAWWIGGDRASVVVRIVPEDGE